jgi:hypothetical protein
VYWSLAPAGDYIAKLVYPACREMGGDRCLPPNQPLQRISPDGFAHGPLTPEEPFAERIRQIYPSAPPFDWPFGPALTDSHAFDLGEKMTELYKGLVERRHGAALQA